MEGEAGSNSLEEGSHEGRQNGEPGSPVLTEESKNLKGNLLFLIFNHVFYNVPSNTVIISLTVVMVWYIT